MKFIDITITAVTAIASVNAIAVPESDHVLQARSIPQPNESQTVLERRSPSSYGGGWNNQIWGNNMWSNSMWNNPWGGGTMWGDRAWNSWW